MELVSIIMPTYNRGYVIERAVKSVVKQSYKNWELIIVDDCSSDNTEYIVKKLISQNENIKYIKKPINEGPSKARNTGIKNSSGRYIAFLDSDDEWLTDHLSDCINALKKTGYKVCSALWKENHYGTVSLVDEDEWFDNCFRNMKRDLGVDRSNRIWKFDDNLFEHIIRTGFYCYHINTLVIEREVIEKVGYLNEELGASEDLDFIFRILKEYRLVTVNDYHFIYYYGNDNIYAFTNRNEIDMNELCKEKKTIQRITFNLENKIKVYRNTKNLLKPMFSKSKRRELEKILDDKIILRSATIVILNGEVNKKKSFEYLRCIMKHMRITQLFQVIGMLKETNPDKICFD